MKILEEILSGEPDHVNSTLAGEGAVVGAIYQRALCVQVPRKVRHRVLIFEAKPDGGVRVIDQVNNVLVLPLNRARADRIETAARAGRVAGSTSVRAEVALPRSG